MKPKTVKEVMERWRKEELYQSWENDFARELLEAVKEKLFIGNTSL